MSEYNVKELVNTAWAFTTAEEWNAPLFVALASEAQRRHVGMFEAQELTNTASASATAFHSDSPLSVVLARAALWCAGKFNT